MIIDCISDLHGYYPALEGGDLLIVGGDLTARDTREEYERFSKWLDDQNYKKKIFIAGNHDNFLEDQLKHLVSTPGMFQTNKTKVFLSDSGIEFEGLKIWGSPWSLTFEEMNPHCKAFTVDTEEELAEKWALIPDDIDILITHSPPYGILDRNVGGKHCGSLKLTAQVADIKPKLHVFGHIHEAYGDKGVNILPHRMPTFMEICKTKSVNASHVNERYQPVNAPIRIII